jgi:ABC-2 type transport system permease protein
MAANAARLEPLRVCSWQAGFGNLVRKEISSWSGTRRWWTQCLLWLVLINGLLALEIHGSSRSQQSLADELGTFFGIFPALGILVLAQSAIVGERTAGTAAWVLSKPVSRAAFILSKFVGLGGGILVTAIALQGVVAYVQLSAHAGKIVAPLPYLTGLGFLFLSLLFYVALSLMLGTVFRSRNPVIAVSVIVLFAQALAGKAFYLPLLMRDLLAGTWGSVPIIPGIGCALATVLLLGVAVWRCTREEF